MKNNCLFFIFFISIMPCILFGKNGKEQKEWHLKSGTKIIGKTLSETESTITVETSFGVIDIKKSDLVDIKIYIKLIDGSQIIGTILKETPNIFKVKTDIGEIEIYKDKISSFEKKLPYLDNFTEFSKQQRVFRPVINPQREKLRSAYSHAIEPVIDIFFDPTAYTFRKGSIYLSGLSLAYGLTDRTLISSNLLSFAGIFNSSGELNPNFEYKYNFYKKKVSKKEILYTVGFRFNAFSENAVTKIRERVTYTPINDNDNYSDRQEKTEELNREEDLRVWRSLNSEDEDFSDQLLTVRERDRYESQTGWKTELYFVRTESYILDRGGRFGYHLGGILQYNHITYKKGWLNRPSGRLYIGSDLDLSRDFKILGEIIYDPDFLNIITQQSEVGVDFGFLYALNDNFRLLVHIQPYVFGIYWRF
ncbi:MAG: hypothetical protein CMP11_00525 [Zetaproteobacteria bacterium]|nr:hypothetical protein [Pseudobdellovibrionaceae bacterium]